MTSTTSSALETIIDKHAEASVNGLARPIFVRHPSGDIDEALSRIGQRLNDEGVELRVIELRAWSDLDEVLLSDVFGTVERRVTVFTSRGDVEFSNMVMASMTVIEGNSPSPFARKRRSAG